MLRLKFTGVFFFFSAFINLTQAQAASLDLGANVWQAFTSGATGLELSNATADVPNVGTSIPILNSTTSQGIYFGFVQKGYSSLPVRYGRFVSVTIKSGEPFRLGFRTVASDGQPYYLWYSGGQAFGTVDYEVKYILAPHNYPNGTANQWQTIWLDLEADLQRLVPGVTLTGTRWVAVRGAVSIAQIAFHETLPAGLSTDVDADGVQNDDEIYGAPRSNPFRIDSDGDGVPDARERICGSSPLQPSNSADLADPDLDGIPNRDEETLQSCRNKSELPMLAPIWEAYAPVPSGQITYPDPNDPRFTVITHTETNANQFGVVNPPTVKAMQLERDQLKVYIKPANETEDFWLYIQVVANSGISYYLTFPRYGNGRSVSNWGIDYLTTPLQSIYGLKFIGAPLNGVPVYLDLTAALRAFPGHEGEYVRYIKWVAVRGRLSLRSLSFPPEVRLPETRVSSGGTVQLLAHDSSLVLGTNSGTLCSVGVDLCAEYQWEDVSTVGQSLLFPFGNNAATVNALAPNVMTPEVHTVRLRVRQPTPQRPAGIWTEGTMQVLVLPPPAISDIVPATATGGDLVTISGSNFMSSGTVNIDGIAASIVSWSDTVIVATVPVGVSPGNVNVVVDAGGTPSAPGSLTVYPNVTSISAPTAVSNTTITLTGTNFGSFWGMVDYGAGPLMVEDWSNTSITVRVLPTDEPGLHGVSVVQNGVWSAPVDLTILPTVYRLAPTEGRPWDEFRVLGGNLGSTMGSVSVGGGLAGIGAWSSTEILYFLPPPVEIPGGDLPVIATTASGLATDPLPVGIYPTVWGSNPSVVIAGDTVTVDGGYFDWAGELTIGGVSSSIVDWAPTQIHATVPKTAGPGSQDIVVVVPGTVSRSSEPVPLSVRPSFDMPVFPEDIQRGRVGDVMTFTGANFGATQGPGDSLTLDGYLTVTPVAWSMTAISFVAPANLPGSWHDIRVTAGGQASDPVSFILTPSITSVSPSTAAWDELVTIKGQSFQEPYNASGMSLTIGGMTVTPTAWFNDTITAAVPFGVQAGNQAVVVTVFGETSNAYEMTVRPNIQEILPSLAQLGKEIRIRGQAFGWEQGTSTISIGGEPAVVSSWSDWEIVATVPPTLPSGSASLVVTVAGVASNTAQVQLIPRLPIVYSADAPAGVPGSPLNIYGMDFGFTQGAGRVVVGGVVATVDSWSDTYIQATVPAGAPGGWVPVSVIVEGPAEYIVPAYTPVNVPAASNQVVQFLANGDAGQISDAHLDMQLVDWGTNQWGLGLQAPDLTTLTLVINGTWIPSATTFDAPTPSVESFDTLNGKSVNGTWSLSIADSRSYWDPAMTIAGLFLRFAAEQAGLQSVPAMLPLAPVISSLTPAWGAPGSSVTIVGSGFGPYPPGTGGVWVGGVLVPFNTWADTAIEFTMPSGLPSGPVQVQVQVEGWYSNASDFTVISGPYIADVAPASASGGATLTISGASFGASQGTSLLTVSGYPMSVLSWTDTAITATLPEAVTGGTRDVRVALLTTTGGGGGTPTVFTPIDTPQLGGDMMTVVSQLWVEPSGTISDLNVSVNVDQTQGYMIDNVIRLRHPDGTVVTLKAVNEGSGSNLTTTYDTLSVPSESLSVFNGKPMAGVWQLEVEDTYPGWGAANINAWSLEISSDGPTSYSPTDVPVTASEGSVALSFLTVGASGTLADVNVSVDIGHSGNWIGDLHVQLHHPDGTIVRLQNATGTDAGTSLVTTYDTLTVPYESLALLNGKEMAGTWALEIVDTYSCCGVGTINNWSLELTPVGGGGGGTTAEYSNLYPITVVPAITALSPTQGEVGQTATIFGTNFGSPTEPGSIVVGGQAVSTIYSWSETMLSFQVPTSVSPGANDVTVLAGGVQSNTVSYTVLPDITGVSPTLASGGSTVTLSGNGFGATQGASTITLGGLSVPVLSWSNTSISVQIPDDHPPGSRVFVVTVGGLAGVGYAITIRPTVTALNPLTGTGGDEIEILGTNFLAAQGTSVVEFQSVSGTVTSWSNTRITARIPNGTMAGTSRTVSVRVNGVYSPALNMTILPNLITVAPTAGVVGTSVTLTGTNFGIIKSTSTLTIGGIAAATSSWTSTQIVATVPAGIAAGSQPIVVTVGGATDTDAISIAPALVAVSPANGPAGATITLTGSSFGASQGASEVRINGTAVTVNTWGNTSITAVVPSGLPLGNYAVVVRVGGVDSNAMTYSVTPFIASLSPAVGTGGDAVTISGSGFGSTQGGSSVSLGGVITTVVAWSNTSIQVTVPDDVTSGTRAFTVAVDGFSSNAVAMTVTPKIGTVTPASATGGDVVTIVGTNFGPAAQTVTIGGTTGAVVSWSMTSILASVPASVEPGARQVAVVVNSQASNGVAIQIVPTLGAVIPVTAPVGANVTVMGSNFGASQATSTLTIGGAAAAVVSWSANSVVATVPGSVAAGEQPVQLVANGNPSNLLPLDVQPLITGYSLVFASDETGVTLTGTSFGASQGASEVLVDGLPVTTSTWSDGSITAWLTEGYQGLPLKVVVAGVESNTIVLPGGITPFIDGRYPVHGTTGTAVTLVGTFPKSGTAAVGGVAAPVVAWYPRVVTITVPAGVAKGQANIRLYATTGVSNAAVFTHQGGDVWVPVGNAPYPRGSFAATWTGREMVVWGGWGTSSRADGGRYNPLTDDWMPMSMIGAPAARDSARAAFLNGRVYVWGGTAASGAAYDPMTDTWSALNPSGAPTSNVQFIVASPTKLFVWGGRNSSGTPINTGAYYDPTLNAWTQMAVDANTPSARQQGAAAWLAGKMYVWGGWNGGSLNTGGAYDPVANAWTALPTAGAPTARFWNTNVAAGVADNDSFYIFGTGTNNSAKYSTTDGLWHAVPSLPSGVTAEFAAWTGTEILAYGSPIGRYDPTTNTWSLSSTVNAPPSRSYSNGVWTGTELIFWAGQGQSSGGRYKPSSDSWTPMNATFSARPPMRSGAVTGWAGDRFLVWGGADSGNVFAKVGWRYDPVMEYWLPMQTVDGPLGVTKTKGVTINDRFYVWGGQDTAGASVNSGASYSAATDSWTVLPAAGAPTARHRHGVANAGSRLAVWGGLDGSYASQSNGAIYNPTLGSWSALPTANAPAATIDFSMVAAGNDKLIVWGGAYANTGGVLNLTNSTWTATAVDAYTPYYRWEHVAEWTGTVMVVWGGRGGSDAQNATGARYNPQTNSWASITTVGAPVSRYLPVTGVIGGKVYMLAGYYWPQSGALQYLRDGAIYDAQANTWTPITASQFSPGGGQGIYNGREFIIWNGSEGQSALYFP